MFGPTSILVLTLKSILLSTSILHIFSSDNTEIVVGENYDQIGGDDDSENAVVPNSINRGHPQH